MVRSGRSDGLTPTASAAARTGLARAAAPAMAPSVDAPMKSRREYSRLIMRGSCLLLGSGAFQGRPATNPHGKTFSMWGALGGISAKSGRLTQRGGQGAKKLI